MDPNATLAELLIAIRDDDRARTIILLEALAGWARQGGFLPDVLTVLKEVAPQLDDR